MTNRKSVIIVDWKLAFGGAEIQHERLALELSSRGFLVKFCLLEQIGIVVEPELLESKVKLENLGMEYGRWSFKKLQRLRNEIRSSDVGIVISGQFGPNSYARLATIGLPNVINIAEEHGVYQWKKWWHRAIDKILVWRPGFILAVSDAVRRDLLSKGIPEKKIRTLRNPVGSRFLDPENYRSESRHSLGIKDTEFVFGHIGSFRIDKGHRNLLLALKMMTISDPWKAVFVGNGPLLNEMQELAIDLKIDQHIIWVSSTRDVLAILDSFDVFVFPSQNEALGISILEAMARKRPVIASNVGGIPEIVEHLQTGILVDPNSPQQLSRAMEVLHRDKSLARSLGASGFEFVISNHGFGSYVDKITQFFTDNSSSDK